MTVNVLKNIAGMLFWLAAAAGAIGLVGLLLGWSVEPSLAVISPFVVIILAVVLSQMTRNIRRRRHLFALSYVEQAVRLNLPLDRFLDSAARSETGALAERLRHLRAVLEGGAAVSSAMERAIPETPPRTIQLTAAAERLGRLPLTLSRLVAEGEMNLPWRTRPTFVGAYLLMMLAAIGGITNLIWIFVLPKFKAIFRDFGTPMPRLTTFVLEFAPQLTGVMGAVLLLAVLAFCARKIWETLHLGQSSAQTVTQMRLWICDHLPIVGAIVRYRSLGDVCQLLADAVEIGHPAHVALEEASHLMLAPSIHRAVSRWERAASAGLPLAQAARRAGMPDLLAGMLANSPGNPADALQFLSRYYSSRFSRTVLLLRGAALPAIVLFVAVLVAMVTLALFLPVVALIQSVGMTSTHYWRL